MSMFGRTGVTPLILLAVVVWPCAACTTDSTGVSAPVERFRPVWGSFMGSKDTYVSMGSDMNITIEPDSGWLIKNSVSIENKSYRGRDMQEISERLMNYASRITDLYTVNFNIGETYMKKKTIGLARFGKDLIVSNESAAFDLKFMKPLLRAKGSTVSIAGDAGRGRSDFKYDRSIAGSASGSLFYEFGELLQFTGGVGTSRRRESSEIGIREIKGLPSKADTFRVNMAYGRGKDKLLAFKYSRTEGIERKVAPPRGNSMEILDNPDLAQEEEAHRKLESLEMKSFLQPFSFLSVVCSFKHDLKSQKNRVDTRLSKEMESTDLTASTIYQYCEKGKIAVDVSREEGVIDYGPFSLSSYDENEKMASVRVSHRIKDSLSVYVKGSASLKQRFYKKRDANPRDADYLLYQANANLEAVPFSRVSTSVSFTMDRYETINIDKSLSGDNRVDYLYRVVPNYKVRPAEWLTISQDYTIKIEFTDFVYKEESNYLNRTTNLNTKALFRIFQPLNFNFRHSYMMRDTGSYLKRGGREVYSPSSENVEHSIYLDLRYQPFEDFTIKALADFRNQRSNRLGSVGGASTVISSRRNESGGLTLGFARKRDIGDRGKLDFDIAYVRRFGPHLSKERKEYWEVDASLKFNF